MAELVGQNEGTNNSYTIRIPSAGEAFRPAYAPTGAIFFREGNQLFGTNLEALGQQLFTPTTEKPTYSHLTPVERQALGQQVLKAEGIDYNAIPQQDFNIADVQGYFGRQGAIQPLTNLSSLGKAVKSTTLVPKANLTLSGGTLEGLNNAQQKEFQDVVSGLSAGGTTFGRTPKGIVDLRTGQIVQSTQTPSSIVSPEALGSSVQITALENKINTQLDNLKAGLSTGGATQILSDLFTKFGVTEEQGLVKQYNQLILDQQNLLRKIPESIKLTLQDVGISEAQYNRLVLKETQKPLEVLRSLMEQKGIAQENINQSLRFVGLFSDAMLQDRAAKLEFAKYEIETNKDLLRDLRATELAIFREKAETERELTRENRADQRKLLELAINEQKDDLKRIQNAADLALKNGADKDAYNYIISAQTGDEANVRLAEKGLAEKPTADYYITDENGQTVQYKKDASGAIIPSSRTVLGGKEPANKEPADKAISLSSQQRRILAGANFLPEEINAIERVLNEAGIEAVLRGIDDETQRKTVSNLFKAGVSLEKVEEEKRVELETEMKKKFTTDELFEISKKLGFAKWWSNKTADINRMFELVNNEQLEEELREK